MSKRKISLHEVSYERLSEAEKKRAHAPRAMTSGCSKGPIKMWICYEPFCESVRYTYVTPHEAPVCFGGAKWSFLTNDTHDSRIHQPWARKLSDYLEGM